MLQECYRNEDCSLAVVSVVRRTVPTANHAKLKADGSMAPVLLSGFWRVGRPALSCAPVRLRRREAEVCYTAVKG